MMLLFHYVLSATIDTVDLATTAAATTTTDTTKVTFQTYISSSCSSSSSVATVNWDTTTICNPTPDASATNLMCCGDRISYTNHPNSNTCEINDNNKLNVLYVGVCQLFPGPVDTWKMIDASTYTCNNTAIDACLTSASVATSMTAPALAVLAAGIAMLVLA
jgi:hypothetical protein